MNTQVFPTAQDVEVAAADLLIRTITRAIQQRGQCLLALSGGNSPRGLYRRLATLLPAADIDLQQLYFIFADERMVPPTDRNSNFGMVQQQLITPLALRETQVIRIKGELPAQVAAVEYEQQLQQLLPRFGGRCDLILLGVGEDGHTASLFPGTSALHEQQHMVSAVFIPSLRSWRVTLTLPFINRARAVVFIACGARKAAIVNAVLMQPQFPASQVRPDQGSVTWMMDSAAASQFKKERIV